MKKTLFVIDRVLLSAEVAFIVGSLGTMVVVAFLQVVLRNLFSTSMIWADEFLRHLLLWTGMIGASNATREGRHIGVDVLSRFFSSERKFYNQILVDFVSAGVCGVLFYSSIKYVQAERECMEMLTSMKIPVWYAEMIFPIAFGLITFRFILHMIEALAGIPRDV
jgi:TRAP-type C4-dicarboxylate transport system permease small subunit